MEVTTLEFKKSEIETINNGFITAGKFDLGKIDTKSGLKWSIMAEARKLNELEETKGRTLDLLLRKNKRKEHMIFKKFLDEKINESVDNLCELLNELEE